MTKRGSKRRLLLSIVFVSCLASLSLVAQPVFASHEPSHKCVTANGKFSVMPNQHVKAYSSFEQIGGTGWQDEQPNSGIQWACAADPNGRATLFFVDKDGYHTKASPSDPDDIKRKNSADSYVVFHPNIDVGAYEDEATIALMGLIHTQSQKTGNVRVDAVDIALCLSLSACTPTTASEKNDPAMMSKPLQRKFANGVSPKMTRNESNLKSYISARPTTDSRYFNLSGITQSNFPVANTSLKTTTITIPRGGNNSPDSYYWTYPRPDYIRRFKIYPKRLYEAAQTGKAKITKSGSNWVEIEIWNYRCWNNVGHSCGPSPMYLTLRKYPDHREVDFTGKSEAEIASSDTANGSYKINFRHEVKRSAGSNNVELNTPLYITEKRNSVVTSGPTEHSFVSSNLGDEKVINSTVDIRLAPGEKITVCQNMKYVSKVVVDAKTYTTTPDACITLERDASKCGFEGLKYDSKNGYNVASIGVMNKNLETGWVDTPIEKDSQGYPKAYSRDDAEVHIWARPGDNIRFRYRMCAAAEPALESWSTDFQETLKDRYNVPQGLASLVKMPTHYTPEATRRYGLRSGEWSKGLSYTSTSPYTFALNRNILDGNIGIWTNVGNSSFMGQDPRSKVVYSPETGSLLNGCPGYTGKLQKWNMYQVAGVDPDDPHVAALCPVGAVNTGVNLLLKNEYNVVGSTISQRLRWTKLGFKNGNMVAPGFPSILEVANRLLHGESPFDSSEALASANVHIPYNYKLSIDNSEVIQTAERITAGSEFEVNYRVNMFARKNSTVDAEPYRTLSKPSKYRVFGWLVDPNVSSDHVLDSLTSHKVADPDAEGRYLINVDPATISPSELMFASGENAVYQGDFNKINGRDINLSDITVRVPADAKVGQKLCVAAAVWPIDSHDRPDASDVGGDGSVESQAVALSKSSNSNLWATSAPSCYTVSKQTSVVIGGGDAYFQNGARTSTSRRIDLNGANRSIGSWAEYSLIAEYRPFEGIEDLFNFEFPSIVGMGSGSSRVGGTTNKLIRGSCYYSPLTIANDNCPTGVVGLKKGNPNAPNIAENRDSFLNAFTLAVNNSQGLPIHELNADSISLNGRCEIRPSSSVFKPVAGANYDCTSDGIRYVKVKDSHRKVTLRGDSTDNSTVCLEPGGANKSNLTVLRTKGTLVIDSDIRRGTRTASGGCNSDPSQSYNSPSEIPQMIIVADRVAIKPQVKHIDAMIFAKDFISCGNDNGKAVDRINVDVCNEPLLVNGPVFANNFRLYRTYGGGSSSTDASSSYYTNGNSLEMLLSPAEIFNYGTENYLWNFSRSGTDSKSMNNSYIKELPPRY